MAPMPLWYLEQNLVHTPLWYLEYSPFHVTLQYQGMNWYLCRYGI